MSIFTLLKKAVGINPGWRKSLLTSIVLVLSLCANAEERIVHDVVQYTQNAENIVTLNFSKSLSFDRIYPGSLCKQCTIMFKPGTSVPAELAEFAKDETLKIPKLSGAYLQAGKYQADANGNISITLDFSQIVNVAVEQGANKRNIKLSLKPYERPKGEVTPNIAPIASSEDKSGIVIPDRVFVITLESSTRPLNLPPIEKFPDLKDYKNYVTRVEFKNQKWYRHRLGFASTEQEAANLLVKAQKYFPKAWIDTASPTEYNFAKKFFALKPELLIWPKEPEKKTEIAATPTPKPKDIYEILSVKPEKAPVVTAPPTTGTDVVAAAPGKAVTPAVETKKVELPTLPPEVKGVNDEKTRSLMERARQAMVDGDYQLAIALYTKVLSSEDQQERKDAREYLGLARERNGQLTKATAEYEEYLRQYPAGEDAERVKQRLFGLTTSTAAPKAELVKSEVKKPEAQWEFNNFLSQYYRYQMTTSSQNPTLTTDNSLSTNLSSTGRYRGSVYDMRYQFNIDNRYSFLEETVTAASTNDTKINTAYLDITDKEWGTSYRVGRQSQNSYGVQGRFDGVFVSYRFDPQWKVNAVYGYPVDFSKTAGVYASKMVEGLSLDMGTFAQHWDMNVYVVNQSVENGIRDRQAVGTEIKFLSQEFTAFSLFDYDYSYRSLNTALMVGSWRFKDNSSININLDYRNSPQLTTSAALTTLPTGVTATTLRELIALYDESTVRRLAQDRIAKSKSITVSVNSPLNTQYQISGDVSYSTTGESTTSVNPDVPAQPSSGSNTSVGSQLIGNSVLFDNDVTVFGVRYSSSSTAKTISLQFNTRAPVNTDWKLNGRLSVDHQAISDGTNRINWRPAFKADYRIDKDMRAEFEVGYDYATSTGGTGGNTIDTNPYVYLGYTYDF